MSLKRSNRLSLDSRMPHRPSTSRWSSHEAQITSDQVELLRRFSRRIINAGVNQLRKEFDQIEGLTGPSYEDAATKNQSKCRYRDVVCWEDSRVKLNNSKNDFIHANMVQHSTLSNRFICSQGPLDHTVTDFWEMIWEQKIKLVIMLCQVMEEKRNKCAQYWPKHAGQSRQYGPFVVKNEMTDQTELGLKRCKLIVQYHGEERTIQHVQWTAWKDRKAPKGSTMAFRLISMARKNSDSPTVVHCSAGVGRTGTLVLLAMLRGSSLKSDSPNTMKLLRDLRSQRGQCIQTEDQYLYLHLAMLQYAVKSRAVTIEEVAGFVHDYEAYVFNSGVSRRSLMSQLIVMSPKENQIQKEEFDERGKSFRVSFHSVPIQKLMQDLSPFRIRER
ncbi:unnamed protein product [Bursaphelenchus okinawaensis]|uniref:Uncharacterized protein n=1 Tax=Bursaphelenchus okinawaensis TaxID=465554 RepID=A0A811LJE6_9BILA|nr:unnamed protein product [Bursaphelenchus okinawaensis]CAG9123538.1 unnamed protein product [Bursaphelenchus okinawaensis]